MENYEEKYEYYSKLMDMSYDEAISTLIDKHGTVIDNYYVEKSYNRFLEGEIKNPTKGKFSKTNEGLFCHHILENKFKNISDKNYISKHQYSYEYQTKEYLVYCDLIEHMILHVLITKETDGENGVNGLCEYLKPMVIDFYIMDIEPNIKWLKLTKERAFLPKDQVYNLLIKVDEMLKDVEIYNFIEEELKEL